MGMINVIIHLRRSKDTQELSIEQQLAECMRFAKEHGWHIFKIFTSYEGHVSGSSLEQDKAFKEMVELSKMPNHGIQYLLVHDTSRFGRMPPKRKIYWQEHFEIHGIKTIYVSQSFKNDGSFADDIHQFLSHHEDREYVVKLSKSTRRGAGAHARLGRSCGGSAPYGYARAEIDQHGNQVRILPRHAHKADSEHHIVWILGSPIEIKLVIWNFEQFAQGNGLKSIVDELNRRRVPSPYGKAWAKSTVRAILRNEAYLGLRIYNRTQYREVGVRIPRKTRPESDWIVVKDAHPAIISQALFDKAQSRFRARKPRDGRHFDSQHLLTGLVYCTRCGHRYCGQPKYHKGKKVRAYECGGFHSKGKHVCQSYSIAASRLEDFATARICSELSKLKSSERLRSRVRALIAPVGQNNQAKIKENLDRELKRKQDELANIIRAMRRATDPDDLLKEMEAVKSEIKQLEEEQAKTAASAPVRTIDVDSAVKEMMSYLGEAERMFKNGTPAERKTVVRAFLARVDIHPEAREARFNFYKIPLPIQQKIAGPSGAGDSCHRDGCGGGI